MLTAAQRLSIDTEGRALVGEYNRIIAVTQYNGLKLLDGSLGSLTLQAGYGESGQLTISIGQQLQRNLETSVTVTTTVADGTFQARTSYSTGTSPYSVALGDINGDGKLDIVTADSGPFKTSVFLGNGNGTFQARTSYSTGSNPISVALGDVNSDGQLDIVSADSISNKTSVLLANSTTNSATTATSISFRTQASARAAITALASVQTSIANERANIGAHLSRIGTAVSNLQQSRENFDAAASRITDVDVAQETAELTRAQILQDASTAVLGQANQQPALVIKLLKGK